MEDQRKNELAVIIAATVAFGGFGRLISTNPLYGIWGFFKWLFYINSVMVGLQFCFILCCRADVCG